MNQLPTIGRIVHAVIQDGAGTRITRPAIIVKVLDPHTAINVQVFCDGDGRGGDGDGLSNCRWQTALTHDETALPAVGTWHWPPREVRGGKGEVRPAANPS